MADEGFKRKLTTILSADVVGYSRLMEDDEEATIQTLNACRNSMSALIQQHGGRVVDMTGDNLMAEFASIVDAVKCAAEIQKNMRARNADLPENRRMLFRIGVNLGDIVAQDDRIYGDGVNIAARLEGLAEGGGICISGAAYDQLKKKLELGYEYLGEHSVKNIAAPVRVYKVLMEPEAVGKVIGEKRKTKKWMPVAAAVIILVGLAGGYLYVEQFKRVEPASGKKMAFPLPEKHAIAVLPFDNMSNDPDQEYFGDGISEDLITDLSKIPDLLVISRLSSFTYKGKAVKIQQIAEELGARYVLEGSVRKINNSVRINAQLIDAASGHHLWAERYDGNTGDIFALQDKITRKIAASLALRLTEDEKDRLAQKGTANMEAYEAYLKGATIANSLRNSADKFAESLPWFEKAVKLDPNYGLAYAALGETYFFGSGFGLQDKLGISSRLVRMRGMNYIRMAMKNPTNIAYRIAGRVYSYRRQHEKALDYGMKAIALAPNENRSNAFMALSLIYAGQADEAVAFSDRMLRADPHCLY